MIKKFLFCLLFTLGLAHAQLSVKPTDGNSTEVPLGAAGARYESAFTAIGTGGTTITSTTTFVQLIYCTNNTGSATTLTIADGASHTYMTTATFAANSVMLINYSAIGLKFASGIILTAANAATLSCQVKGVQ